MKTIVTGGAGFIGSHTVDLLLERGHEVLVIDDLSSGRRANLNASVALVPVSVLARGVPEIIAEFAPQAIIHLAAQPSLRASLDDPVRDARVNILGTLYMLAAARACGAKFVFASTSAVYPAEWVQPYGEDDDCLPNLPYGIAKYAAELYVRSFGVPYVVLRYGNVYGPRQVEVGENQLVPHCLRHLVAGSAFVVHGDGASTRDFVYVGDIARANVWACEEEVSGVYNAATGISSSVNLVCTLLALECAHDKEVILDYPDEVSTFQAVDKFEHGPAKAGEARHVQLDCRKIHAAGWRHAVELADGLQITADSWRKVAETA